MISYCHKLTIKNINAIMNLLKKGDVNDVTAKGCFTM